MESLTQEIRSLREENKWQKCEIQKYDEFKEESQSCYESLKRQYDNLFTEQYQMTSMFNMKIEANEVRIELQDGEITQLRQQLERKDIRVRVLEKEATAARKAAVEMRGAMEEVRRVAKAAQDEAMTAQNSLETRLQTLGSEKQDLLRQLASAREKHAELDRTAQKAMQATVEEHTKMKKMLKEKEQMRDEKKRVEIACKHLKAGFATAFKLWYEWTRTLETMANERAEYLMITLDKVLTGPKNDKRWNYFTEWRVRQSLRQCADLEITDPVASRLILAYFFWQGLDGTPAWAEEAEWSQLSQYLRDTPPAQLTVNNGSATHDQTAYQGPSLEMMSAFRKSYELELDEALFIQLGYLEETEDIKIPEGWDVDRFITQDCQQRVRENDLKEKAREEEAREEEAWEEKAREEKAREEEARKEKEASNAVLEVVDGAVNEKTNISTNS